MVVGAATLLYLIFGGSAGVEHVLTDIKKPVKAAVAEKERAKEIIQLSNALKKELKAQDKQTDELMSDLFQTSLRYDATREDFMAVFERLHAERRLRHQKVLDTRTAMKELMTADEWARVFASPPPD